MVYGVGFVSASSLCTTGHLPNFGQTGAETCSVSGEAVEAIQSVGYLRIRERARRLGDETQRPLRRPRLRRSHFFAFNPALTGGAKTWHAYGAEEKKSRASR